MKKIFSLLFVSFLLIGNGYAGRWDGYKDDDSKIVSEEGNLMIDLSASTVSINLSDEHADWVGSASDLYVYLQTSDPTQSFTVSLVGDEHFALNGSPNKSAYAGVCQIPWRFENAVFGGEEGPTSLPAGVYTTTMNISCSAGSLSCVLTVTVGEPETGGEDGGEDGGEPEPEPEVFADGALLSGVFSVSATKKVYFSRGNLLWDGSAWKMENTQYNRPTSLNSNHVSHLFWTTTAEKSHAETLGYYEDVAPGDHLFCDGSDAEHMLTVDGVSDLFILSYDEWHYLFDPYYGRANAGYLYRYPVTVCGVEGVVIAPDNYDYVNSPLLDSYDEAAFAAAEAAGIVFLPGMGVRAGDELLEEGYWTYWTSTMSSDVREYATSMVGTNYNNYDAGGYQILGETTDPRNTGRGIRLVQERIPGPQSTYTVYVKAPVCDGMNMEAGITGTFASGKVEKMKRGADNWYSYTFTAEKEEGTGSFFFAEVDGNGIYNYIRSIDGAAKFVVDFDLNQDQTFEFDLSQDYEWSRCGARQTSTTSVREVHFYVERPVIGNAIPATITVDFVYLNNTVTETMDANWNRAGDTFVQGLSYYSNPDLVAIYSHGSMTDARYFWHIGDETVIETENHLMPTARLNGLDIYKQLSEVVLSPADVCTLEFDVRSEYPLSEQSFSWFVRTPDNEYHAAMAIAPFTITSNETLSTLSFPATLLPAGDYKFTVYYSAKVDGSGEKTTVYSRDAVVTVLGGCVVSDAESGTGTYSPRTGTLILEDYTTDAETTETAGAIIRETATILYDGTIDIDASETGFEMGGTLIIESASDDATMTIRAPKPIYSASETSELILDGIEMTLDGEDEGPALASRRAEAHAAYMAPRRAQLEDGGHSVISGFASLTLTGGSKIFSPAGAEYDTDARELVDAEGNLVKKAFIAVPDYSRNINGVTYGTICLPQAVARNARLGATYYNVDGVVKEGGMIVGIVLVEETGDLVAGKPYIFEATDTQLDVVNNGGDATVQPANGLVGNLGESITISASESQYYYVLSGETLYHLAGSATATIGKNKAYLNLEGVAEYTPQSQVQNRAVVLPVNGIATNLENNVLSTEVKKVLIDGKIFIFRGGNLFDLTGRIVK